MLTKEQIQAMSVTERLELAEALWDSLRSEEEREAIPEWQKKILEERLKYSLAHPDDGTPWEAFFEQLKSRRKYA